VDLGAPKRPVTLTTANGLELRGWYMPSRNGAAVALMHGTGGNRLGVADHARLLARHGYGVLLCDFQGHGASDGRSTSLAALPAGRRRRACVSTATPGTEARANEEHERRGGPTTELWNLPHASHAAALRTDPAGYERRVIGFLTARSADRGALARRYATPERCSALAIAAMRLGVWPSSGTSAQVSPPSRLRRRRPSPSPAYSSPAATRSAYGNASSSLVIARQAPSQR
jgi:pimeloyl-ACP methyl ester carboxylesterase